MTWVFVRLKARLLIHGTRRSLNSKWSRFAFAVSMVASLAFAVIGFLIATQLESVFDPSTRHRMIVLGTCFVIYGWWFGPLVYGGVDETIDPARLALLPLSRRQIRRGQIAAGFVGQGSFVVVVWMIGVVIGLTSDVVSFVLVTINAVAVLLTAVIGSRALSTTLARLSRSRRGGDAAALIAVLGGALLFAGFQAVRFVDERVLDSMVDVLHWTPAGLGGEAFEFAADGRVGPMSWRTAAIVGLGLVAGWWWSRQLDRLMIEPSRSTTGPVGNDDDDLTPSRLAIFDGVRRRLPRTPVGAAVAREVVYLTRSPGRRAALLAGTVLGFVYVAFVVVSGQSRGPGLVLFAPVAMVFSLQYSSNQLGVDPSSFWLEVVTGAPGRARWAGRQLLGMIAVMIPVTCSATALAAWTGGWSQWAIVMVAMTGAAMTMVGVGSLMSPVWVTPVPDSGNPFATRQSMSGAGCSAGLLGVAYMLLSVIVLVPAELAMYGAVRSGSVLIAVVVAVGTLSVNLGIWWWATLTASQRLERQELSVLAKLDARLNA